MLETGLSLMMLAMLALLAGAVFLWRRGERQRPVLMAVLAVIMAVNVAVWTVPTTGGQTLVGAAQK